MRIATVATAAALLVLAACIERDNPWDPVNYTPAPAVLDCSNPALAGPVRDSLDTLTRTLFATSSVRAPMLDSALQRSAADSTANARTAGTNSTTRAANAALIAANDSLRRRNDTLSTPSRFAFLDTLDSLNFLAVGDTTWSAVVLVDAITIARLRADSAITRENARCAQGIIIPDSLRSAWLSPFDSLHGAALGTQSRVVSLARSSADTNRLSTTPYNDVVSTTNGDIRRYNDSLRFVISVYTHGQITNTNTLEQLIYSATPGDTFVVGPGTFDPVIRFANSGTPSDPILILGQPGMSTVFAAADAILSGTRDVHFRNIVFRRSTASGVKLEANAGRVVFEHCWFDSNAAHGLEVVDSDIRLTDCRITRNGAAGMRISSTTVTHNTATLVNTLVASNALSGIDALSCRLQLTNVTIAGNRLDGVQMPVPEYDFSAASTLITHNRRYGVNWESGYNGQAVADMSVSVLWANVSGNVRGAPGATFNYLSIPVMYVDTASLNYGIAPNTALDSLERSYPPVIIGYRAK